MGKTFKSDNLGDALKEGIKAKEEAIKANRIDVNNLQPIRFTIRPNNGQFDVYLESQTHEVYSGTFPTRAMAEEAVKRCNNTISRGTTKITEPAKHYKVTTPTLKHIQAVALNLDSARRIRFRESMIGINYLIHILTDAIDENASLFDAFFDNQTKTRIKTINKQLDAVLDAIYKSKVMGETDDDYTAIASASYALRERFEIFVNYIAKDDWRLVALDKAFDNILPKTYVDEERIRIAEAIKRDIVGEAEIKEKNILK